MHIERIYGPLSTTGTADTNASGKATTRPASNANEPDLEESQHLSAAMKDTAEVRSEAVAKAKALASDSSYPSDEQLEKLAGLLAKNWPTE